MDKSSFAVSGGATKNLTLLSVVLDADEVGFEAGEEPKLRAFKNIMRVVQRLQPGGGTVLIGPQAPDFVTKAHKIIDKLYRPSDTGIGSIHSGAIMFRDIFARVYIPVKYGNIGLNSLAQSDLSEMQKRWLKSRPNDYALFDDQFLDLLDFAYGLVDLDRRSDVAENTKNFLNLAHFQLEAAAATVTAQCDLRGAIQSCLLSVELSLKAAILSLGIHENALSNLFGHDYIKMSSHLRKDDFQIDHDRICKVLKVMPKYVPNRYSSSQPNRIETGHILMGAQYIASEIMRCLSGRNTRFTSGKHDRYYP